MLQGNTILEFAREKKVNNRIKREVVKRIEKHNDITPLFDNVLNSGNFMNMINNSALIPVYQWFNGCLLTDNPNDASTSMIAGNSNITAQSGHNAYSGSTNSKRGSFNGSESGEITGGYRNVFDWSTSQGNGVISSVCLCPSEIGTVELFEQASSLDSSVNSSKHLGVSSSSAEIIEMSCIDYKNERAYKISYSSGTLNIKEYSLNTYRLLLLEPLLNVKLLASHDITVTISNSNIMSFTPEWDNHILNIFTTSGGTLYQYIVNLNNWTVTTSVHTYQGISFYHDKGEGRILINDGYFYTFSSGGAKIAKCSITNDADVTEYNNPLATDPIYNASISNGFGTILKNGDMIWKCLRDRNATLYYHNGNFYATRIERTNEGTYSATSIFSDTEFGTFLNINSDLIKLNTMFPYVSTVNNLEEAVTKSADLSMKLTYEITEQAT